MAARKPVSDLRRRGIPARLSLLLAVCILAGIVPSAPAEDALGALLCPATGHWYKRFPGPVNWQTAKFNASSLGGYLATVTSAAEDTWLASNFSLGATWLGATNQGYEGNWSWITGEAWSYTRWLPGAPDNLGGSEDFLEVAAGAAGWNDAVWNRPDGYLVEWDEDPFPPPVPVPPPAAPTELAASVIEGWPITLSWKDNSTDESAFEIERRAGAYTFFPVGRPIADATTMADAATVPGTLYTYRVRALNAGGVSAWTNEASATASAFPLTPRPPANLVVVAATRDSVELAWTDESHDETGFEVHRRSGNGEFAPVGTTEPGAGGFLDEGLPPDTGWVYGVRAVNGSRVSSFTETAASTLATLVVATLKGDLRDRGRFLGDSLRATASFRSIDGESDGTHDAAAEGVALHVGPEAAPLRILVPPGDAGWRTKGGKSTWKGPRGQGPRYLIRLDADRGILTVSVRGFEFEAPPGNPVRVSVAIGDDAGSDTGEWVEAGPGKFRRR